jgi:hypothetical protein
MKIEDPLASAEEDITSVAADLARAEAVLQDIRDAHLEPVATKYDDAIGELAVEKAELESAHKRYLDALDDDTPSKRTAARKALARCAGALDFAQEEADAAAKRLARVRAIAGHVEDYVGLVREDLAKAKEGHAGALSAHEKLQSAIVQEIETLSPGFAEGAVPIARLWEAVLTAGHVGFVYKGRVPDGAEYRYAKAKEALVKSGRMTEAKGFCVLNAAGEKARVLALLD